MKLLLTISLVALAMILLSVGVIFRKDKQFRSQHLSQSAAMRERGIGCVVSEDRKARNKENKKIKINDHE